MITKLLRGYEWELLENKTVRVTDKKAGTGVFLDKVGQYSLLCFLIRVLRHRRVKK